MIHTVTFKWSDAYGFCYECGHPAAFYATDAHDKSDKPLGDEHKRCPDCAANDAADGMSIIRIEDAPVDSTELLLKALRDAWGEWTGLQWSDKHWRAVLESAKPDIDEFAIHRVAEIADARRVRNAHG